MFNMSGSEIVFLLIVGLVVLGPEKLPMVLRKAGRLYGEFKRITSGAESEFRANFAEPIREMQETANAYKSMFSDAAGGVKSAARDIAKSVEGEYNSAASPSGSVDAIQSGESSSVEVGMADSDLDGASDETNNETNNETDHHDDVVEGI
jgi:sec-independent protein translocase protein TatB